MKLIIIVIHQLFTFLFSHFRVWQENPASLVGLVTRAADWSNKTKTYSYDWNKSAIQSMVLTGALFASKYYSYVSKLPDGIPRSMLFNNSDFCVGLLPLFNFSSKGDVSPWARGVWEVV